MVDRAPRNIAIEEQIILQGPGMRERLIGANCILSPSELTPIVAAYQEFKPSPDRFLWSRSESSNNEHGTIKYPKLFFLLSGVSKAGKHALIRKMIDMLGNQMTGLVTATTRGQKEDEIDGRNHHFWSP